jgi:hypothetical protein
MYVPDLSSLPLDPYWDTFVGLDSHEDFETLADSVAFREEVPPDVAGRFDLVRRALRLSAVDANMVDAALGRALLSLELALRHRHEEFKGPLKDPTLYRLIEWGGRKHLFENGPEALHSARQQRNKLVAHPRRDTRLLMLGLGVVREISTTINELYADPDLRMERTRLREDLHRTLSWVRERGGLIDLSEQDIGRLIIYDVNCPFVENRGDEKTPILYLLAWPLFDPTPDHETIRLVTPLLIPVCSWQHEPEGVRLTLHKEGEVSLAAGSLASRGVVSIVPLDTLPDPELVHRYETWRTDLDSGPVDTATLFSFVSHRNAEVRTALRYSAQPPLHNTAIQSHGSVKLAAGETTSLVVPWSSQTLTRGSDR